MVSPGVTWWLRAEPNLDGVRVKLKGEKRCRSKNGGAVKAERDRGGYAYSIARYRKQQQNCIRNNSEKLAPFIFTPSRKRVLQLLLPAGLRVAQPCRYCFYSLAQKWVFRPAGATRCPDKRESWHCGPIPSANFHVYRGKNVGIQPPKLSKFRILARHLYLRGDSFAIFLRHSQRLYVYR